MAGNLGSEPSPGVAEPTIVSGFRHQAAIAGITVIGVTVLLISLLTERYRRGWPIDIERPYRASTPEFRVDINQAEWAELTILPNISETMARRVVAYRESHGPFINADDLLGVRGIGPRTLAGLKPYLLPIVPETAAGEGAVELGRTEGHGPDNRVSPARE